MYMNVFLNVCHMHVVPAETRRGCWNHWNWSEIQLWATMRVFLNLDPTANALNCQAITPDTKVTTNRFLKCDSLCLWIIHDSVYSFVSGFTLCLYYSFMQLWIIHSVALQYSISLYICHNSVYQFYFWWNNLECSFISNGKWCCHIHSIVLCLNEFTSVFS